MTPPSIEALIDDKAHEYAEVKKEGLNGRGEMMYFADRPYLLEYRAMRVAAFKAGVPFGQELERKRAEKLILALRYYSNGAVWSEMGSGAYADIGKIAREALKEWGLENEVF